MINTDSLIDVIAFQTECTGLDLLTTVLCAVNAKAARIRKNHQEQSQVGEGEGTFYASIIRTSHSLIYSYPSISLCSLSQTSPNK